MDALSRATNNAVTLIGVSQTLSLPIFGSSQSTFKLLCQLKTSLADLLNSYKHFLHQVVSESETIGLLEDILDACFLLRRSLWEVYHYPLLRSLDPSYLQLMLAKLTAITRLSRSPEPEYNVSYRTLNQHFETLSKTLDEFHTNLSELHGLGEVDIVSIRFDKQLRRSIRDLNYFRPGSTVGESRHGLSFMVTEFTPSDIVSFDKKLHTFFDSIVKHPGAQIRSLPRILTSSLSTLLAIIQNWRGAFYVAPDGSSSTKMDITPALNAMFSSEEAGPVSMSSKVEGVYIWQAIVHFRHGIRANIRSFHYWAQYFCQVYQAYQESRRWVNRLRSGYLELGAIYALAVYSLFRAPPRIPAYAFVLTILYPTVLAFLKHFSFFIDQLKFRLVIPVVGCYCVLLWHMEGGPRLPPPSTTIVFGLDIPASKTFLICGEPFRLTTIAIASLLIMWCITSTEPIGTFFTMAAIADLFVAHLYGQDGNQEKQTEEVIERIPGLVQDLNDIASAWQEMELVLDSYEAREGAHFLSRTEQVHMFQRFKAQCMPFSFDQNDATEIERIAKSAQRMCLTGNMLACCSTHPKEYCTTIERGKGCPVCMRHRSKKKKAFRERDEDRLEGNGAYKLVEKRARLD